ncbi:MAG: hypothetical protein KIS87_11885 [Phycisphaeraceae bacterium]|nr:hypothetical protein [Phycisphaeraceae bacterium]
MRRRVAAVLALGLLTTLAVAWSLAWWPQPHRSLVGGTFRVRYPDSGEGAGFMVVNRYAMPGRALYESAVWPHPNPWPDLEHGDPVPERFVSLWARPAVLPWGRSVPWPGVDSRVVQARGWPWPAVWCEFRTEQSATPEGRYDWYRVRPVGGIALTSTTFPGGRDWPHPFPAVLPLRPAWPGLLGNCALYSAAWAMLLLPRPLIRWNRRRRGRCECCGYDLHGLPDGVPCPECGSSSAPAARQPRSPR